MLLMQGNNPLRKGKNGKATLRRLLVPLIALLQEENRWGCPIYELRRKVAFLAVGRIQLSDDAGPRFLTEHGIEDSSCGSGGSHHEADAEKIIADQNEGRLHPWRMRANAEKVVTYFLGARLLLKGFFGASTRHYF